METSATGKENGKHTASSIDDDGRRRHGGGASESERDKRNHSDVTIKNDGQLKVSLRAKTLCVFMLLAFCVRIFINTNERQHVGELFYERAQNGRRQKN